MAELLSHPNGRTLRLGHYFVACSSQALLYLATNIELPLT